VVHLGEEQIMRRWLAILLMCVSFAPSAAAQQPARGLGVKVEFALDPGTITEGEEFTLTLTVRNAFNPTHVTRPDLRKLKDFEQKFQIADVPAKKPVQAGDREVKFAYRLRPRSTGKVDIPRLAFTFFTPADKPNITYTQGGLFVTVNPAVTVPAAVVPVEAPAEWFELVPVEGASFRPSPGVLLALAVLGPIVSVAWFLAWRRMYPDAATLMKLRRSRAVRHALRVITQATRDDDPARTIATAVRGYLRDRLGLPESATTPAEVRDALSRFEPPLPADCIAETERLLQACDAARFSNATELQFTLPSSARALIAAWEAE
jgi:hypothetical protein